MWLSFAINTIILAMEKQKEILDEKILMEKYGDYLLSEGKRPVNVHSFMKKLGYEEGDFYQYFSGFESIEREFLVYFFKQSLELTKETEDYQALTSREKLLNFYFIFFENLNMNRSLVLMILDTDVKSKIINLKYLKAQYLEFVQTLDFSSWKAFDKLPEGLKSKISKPQEQALWVHFLSVLKFWKNDLSAGFEKTDMYIEKSMNTGFELMENSLIEKMVDLGKFLFYERFQ